MLHKEFQVWVLGYNQDMTANDFEECVAVSRNLKKAIKCAENYQFSKHELTPHASIVVEHVLCSKTFECAFEYMYERQVC